LEEPGGEAPRRIEAWRRLDDSQPGVLVEVLDITPAGLPAEKRQQRPLPAPAERLQRAGIAARDPNHEGLVRRLVVHPVLDGPVSRGGTSRGCAGVPPPAQGLERWPGERP